MRSGTSLKYRTSPANKLTLINRTGGGQILQHPVRRPDQKSGRRVPPDCGALRTRADHGPGVSQSHGK